MVRAEGLEPSQALLPNGFSYQLRLSPPPSGVCGLDYPFTFSRLLRGSGAARLVSTPSRTGFRSGLARDCHFRFPRIWAVLHRRFPGRALKFVLSPVRMPFRHARVVKNKVARNAANPIGLLSPVRLPVSPPGRVRFQDSTGCLLELPHCAAPKSTAAQMRLRGDTRGPFEVVFGQECRLLSRWRTYDSCAAFPWPRHPWETRPPPLSPPTAPAF